MANKPMTLEEMKAYVDATWEKCQAEAWQEPRQWQGLTDEEIATVKHLYDWTAGWTIDRFARAIEARLKERNT